MPPIYHRIAYTYHQSGRLLHGHTVVTAVTPEDARRKFQRQHPHVTVVP